MLRSPELEVEVVHMNFIYVFPAHYSKCRDNFNCRRDAFLCAKFDGWTVTGHRKCRKMLSISSTMCSQFIDALQQLPSTWKLHI